MTRDMTAGSPTKLLLAFTVPLLFGNIFQQLYSMVDTIIVGQFLGTGPLAAVGSTGSINFLIIGFCEGVCSGFAIPIAQRFGSKDFDDLRRFMGNIVWLAVAFAVALAVLTVVFCRPLLQLMQTPADIIDNAYDYIVIIFAGIPATFFYNILASALRALGDSKTPVLFLVLSSVINVVLDLLLVVVIPMGVAGAAVATVISQAISGLCCLLFVRKRFRLLCFTREDAKLEREHVKILLNMGLPMGLQFSITAIGSVILQASVNLLGSGAVAAVTAGSKLSNLCCCAFDALGVGMSTYGGQNIGACKKSRLTPGVRAGMTLGSIYAVVILVVLILFGQHLATLFVDAGETEIIADAYQMLVTNAAFYIPLVGIYVFRLVIQGVGYSKVALFAGVAEMAARTVVGLVFVPLFGFTAACFASPIAWICADCFLIPAYFMVLKRLPDDPKPTKDPLPPPAADGV